MFKFFFVIVYVVYCKVDATKVVRLQIEIVMLDAMWSARYDMKYDLR